MRIERIGVRHTSAGYVILSIGKVHYTLTKEEAEKLATRLLRESV